MKKNKKTLFLILGLMLFLAISCTKNSITPNQDVTTAIAISAVPTAVKNALTTNFPSATNATWSKVSPTVIQASFTSSLKAQLASFKTNGTLLYVHDVIAPSTLPATITDYLDANYKGYVIVKVGNKLDKTTSAVTGYVVEFTLNNLVYELRFDATGKFLSLEMEDGSHEGTQILQAALPAAITTYLDANYKGYTFVHTRSDMTNGVISGYDVEITLNGVSTGLLFDTAGKFVSLETNEGTGEHGGKGNDGKNDNNGTAILQKDLPAVVTTYLDTNYKSYTFVSAVIETKGTTVTEYEVNITYNSVNYHVEFDGNGVFVKVN